jgi:hypothetical protein
VVGSGPHGPQSPLRTPPRALAALGWRRDDGRMLRS